MKNLEQIRAAKALAFFQGNNGIKGEDDGAVISKLPALIIRDGLLATLAFCKSKGADHERLADELCKHLYSPDVCIISSPGFRPGESKLDPWIRGLCSNSVHLRLATAEALAYLAYLKRFQPKKEKSE